MAKTVQDIATITTDVGYEYWPGYRTSPQGRVFEAADGRAIVVYYYRLGGATARVYFAWVESDPTRTSWSTPNSIADYPGYLGTQRLSAVMDPSGNVHVAMMYYEGAWTFVRYCKLTKSETGWTAGPTEYVTQSIYSLWGPMRWLSIAHDGSRVFVSVNSGQQNAYEVLYRYGEESWTWRAHVTDGTPGYSGAELLALRLDGKAGKMIWLLKRHLSAGVSAIQVSVDSGSNFPPPETLWSGSLVGENDTQDHFGMHAIYLGHPNAEWVVIAKLSDNSVRLKRYKAGAWVSGDHILMAPGCALNNSTRAFKHPLEQTIVAYMAGTGEGWVLFHPQDLSVRSVTFDTPPSILNAEPVGGRWQGIQSVGSNGTATLSYHEEAIASTNAASKWVTDVAVTTSQANYEYFYSRFPDGCCFMAANGQVFLAGTALKDSYTGRFLYAYSPVAAPPAGWYGTWNVALIDEITDGTLGYVVTLHGWMDASENVYIAYANQGYTMNVIKFVKFTRTASGWTKGTPVTVKNGAPPYPQKVQIVKVPATGRLWIFVASPSNGLMHLYYSNDDGATWTQSTMSYGNAYDAEAPVTMTTWGNQVLIGWKVPNPQSFYSAVHNDSGPENTWTTLGPIWGWIAAGGGEGWAHGLNFVYCGHPNATVVALCRGREPWNQGWLRRYVDGVGWTGPEDHYSGGQLIPDAETQAAWCAPRNNLLLWDNDTGAPDLFDPTTDGYAASGYRKRAAYEAKSVVNRWIFGFTSVADAAGVAHLYLVAEELPGLAVTHRLALSARASLDLASALLPESRTPRFLGRTLPYAATGWDAPERRVQAEYREWIVRPHQENLVTEITALRRNGQTLAWDAQSQLANGITLHKLPLEYRALVTRGRAARDDEYFQSELGVAQAGATLFGGEGETVLGSLIGMVPAEWRKAWPQRTEPFGVDLSAEVLRCLIAVAPIPLDWLEPIVVTVSRDCPLDAMLPVGCAIKLPLELNPATSAYVVQSWSVLRQSVGPLPHTWRVFGVNVAPTVLHQWSVIEAHGAEVQHVWRVMPSALIVAHSEDIHLPYGTVEKVS